MKNTPVLLVISSMLCASVGHANGDTVPFVIVRDDGTVQNTPYDTSAHANAIANKLRSLYRDTDSALPTQTPAAVFWAAPAAAGW